MTTEQRPRILIVTRNLPPLVGGMERLNWHMAEELAKIAEVRIVGPAGSAALAPAGVPVREAPLKPLWKFLLRARALACREARTWKPDLVLAGSGLTAPLARAAARTCRARTAVYVHGLDVAVKHPAYRAIWLPALRRMDRVIANSRATAALCRAAGIEQARIGIVHPGVDMPAEPIFLADAGDGHEILAAGSGGRDGDAHPLVAAESLQSPSSSFRTPRNGDPESSSSNVPGATVAAFRERHGLGNRPLLLSVGRLSARKGLREFVTQALPQIAAVHPDVMLLIVGDAPNQALHAEAQTQDSIRAAAAAGGLAANLDFLGKVSDAELTAAFRAADVHVFPIREIPGDPEGFGMVAVEAAAHGLPTVAFSSGGVVDAVAEGRSGHLVAPGDYTSFAKVVLRTLSDREALRGGCTGFARQFAWPSFGAQIAVELMVDPPTVMTHDLA